MLPFLYDDLHGLLTDIVSKFLKSKVLAECKTPRSLCEVDYSDSKNQLGLKISMLVLVQTKSYLTSLVVTEFRMMKSKSSEKSVCSFWYSQLASLLEGLH